MRLIRWSKRGSHPTTIAEQKLDASFGIVDGEVDVTLGQDEQGHSYGLRLKHDEAHQLFGQLVSYLERKEPGK
jgi:hypothetical protein